MKGIYTALIIKMQFYLIVKCISNVIAKGKKIKRLFKYSNLFLSSVVTENYHVYKQYKIIKEIHTLHDQFQEHFTLRKVFSFLFRNLHTANAGYMD